ncbi:MAG: amidohydrolase [Pyrinomonadaceae bacterium]
MLPADPVAAQPLAAELILVNGKVHTFSDRQPRAEAIAVAGGKIIAVGTDREIRARAGERTQVIDAGGGLVLPGFIDPHVHLIALGNRFSTLDLRTITEPAALYARLREYVRFLPKGRWILGSGGGGELWDRVDGAMLDRETPENPVFLYHSDAMSAIANSRAFRAAGIEDAAAGSVRGTNFERIRQAVPSDHTRRWAEVAETASNYAASYGVTSVHDTDSDDRSAVYRELAAAGHLKTRIYDCIKISEWKKLAGEAKRSRETSGLVRTGCLKGTADADGASRDSLQAHVTASDKAGSQILLHAIGGRQIATALDLFEQAVKANGKRDRRFRIEHAERASEDDILRMRRLGVIASAQPHLFGGANANREYYARLAKAGIPVIFGSDAPMTDLDPFFTLRAAVGPENGDVLIWESAVRRMTTGPAWAEFQEKVKGKIEPGMLADIVVLDPERSGLANSFGGVRFTIVDGRVVYRAD